MTVSAAPNSGIQPAVRFLAVLACGCALGTASCVEEDTRDALPDWSDGYERDLPAVEPTDGDNGPHSRFPEDSFGIAIPDDVTYPLRIRKQDTKNQRCAVKQGSNDAEITCVLEMNELDLHVLGVKYDIVAPEGMCDFIQYRGYLFQNFDIREGPKEVSWTVEEDGTITDEINAVKGKPTCDAELASSYPDFLEVPECCYGDYTLTVTHAQTGKVSESKHMWDINPADCHHGAAFFDKDAVFNDLYFPMWLVIYIDRAEFVQNVEYEGLSEFGFPNSILANHFDPADHDNDAPAAFNGELVQAYYEAYCLDDADEIIAHVQMLVREWNEEAEFDVDGDPDTEGTEPGWDTPINDILDWADLTPGNTEYPGVLPIPRQTRDGLM